MPLISILIILKVMLVSIVQIVLLSMVKNLSVLLKLCYFVVLFIHSMSFTTTTTPLHSFQWLHSVLLFSFFFFFLIQTSKIKALTQECIFINRLGGVYLLLDFLFVSLVSLFFSDVFPDCFFPSFTSGIAHIHLIYIGHALFHFLTHLLLHIKESTVLFHVTRVPHLCSGGASTGLG